MKDDFCAVWMHDMRLRFCWDFVTLISILNLSSEVDESLKVYCTL